MSKVDSSLPDEETQRGMARLASGGHPVGEARGAADVHTAAVSKADQLAEHALKLKVEADAAADVAAAASKEADEARAHADSINPAKAEEVKHDHDPEVKPKKGKK